MLSFSIFHVSDLVYFTRHPTFKNTLHIETKSQVTYPGLQPYFLSVFFIFFFVQLFFLSVFWFDFAF